MKFCEAVGRPELIDDPRMQALLMSPEQKGGLFAILNEIFPTDTTDNWVARLRAHGQRVAPVNDYDRVVADEHNSLNGYIVEVDHPQFGRTRWMGIPSA